MVRGVNDCDIAWAAGLFEGEGWSEMTYSKTAPDAARRARLALGSTDLDVVEKLQSIFGGTIIHRDQTRYRFPNAKPMHVWRLASMSDVAVTIRAMLPWLCERRTAQLRRILDAIDAAPPAGTSGMTHCVNGHELTPDNLVNRENGYKRCRQCRADYDARLYARKKAAASGTVDQGSMPPVPLTR